MSAIPTMGITLAANRVLGADESMVRLHALSLPVSEGSSSTALFFAILPEE